MTEQQNTEYKQTWSYDYLKWIAAFANSKGGSIYIGKDDQGRVTGVADYKRLLDDLPNKIRDILGIMTEVNLHETEGKQFLEIITSPYSVPISFRGAYYIRSGSTSQELKGNALMEFLLRKAGKSWDDVIEPSATLAHIDKEAVERYLRAAVRSGRLPDMTGISLPDLLEKLRLYEDGMLKRAAIILFGKDPRRFYLNMQVKMGRFGQAHDDLKFQETAEGNLIHLLQEVPEILNRKFFTKTVSFEGLQRIEKGDYPVAALREILLNALVHQDYMGSFVQIRIYDDCFNCWNAGSLPPQLSPDALKGPHSSYPRNTLIADVCFKGGYIDSWGQGILKIINSCREAGLPEPEIIERHGGMLVTLFKDRFNEVSLRKMGLNEREIRTINYLKEQGEITNSKYQELNKVGKTVATVELQGLVEKRLVIQAGTKGRGSKYKLIGR